MIIVTDNGTVTVPEPSRAPRPSPKPRLAITWTGADGKEWSLFGGAVTLLSGARGFGMPTPQHWRRDNLLDGAVHAGLRIPPREVYLPVQIRSEEILTVDRSFFAGLDPRAQGRLRVTQPGTTWRELVLRYEDGAEGEYVTDPLLAGSANYPIRLMAEDPYWLGEPVVERFSLATATPRFFTGPPFRLAPSEILGRSSLVNDGDVEAFARWRVDGPFSSFTVGIGDALVKYNLPKKAGQWVEIDTAPSAKTITDETGANLWPVADQVSMAPLPPGRVNLTTVVPGASASTAVEVSFTPRYYRAW